MKWKAVLALMAMSLLFRTIQAEAYPAVGVSKMIPREENGGTVLCATVSANIYNSPNEGSSIIGRVLTNQLIKAMDYNNGFYRIKMGNGWGYVAESSFVDGIDAVIWIRNSPVWFKQNVVMENDATAYNWISGKPFMVVRQGEVLQLKEKSGDFYVCIYTQTDDGGNEENTLVNVSCSDCKLVYDLHVTNPDNSGTGIGIELAEYACSFVGCPYVWGGTDPRTGADCSGFVQYVYKAFGYDIPRTSWLQAEEGVSIEFDDLRPGDLLFYQRGKQIGHVAIYIGDGMVVQARGAEYGICITPYDYSVPQCAKRFI